MWEIFFFRVEKRKVKTFSSNFILYTISCKNPNNLTEKRKQAIYCLKIEVVDRRSHLMHIVWGKKERVISTITYIHGFLSNFTELK